MKRRIAPLYPFLILSCAALSHAEEITATTDNQPGQYVNADQWRADQEIDLVSQGHNPQGLTASAFAQSMAVSHGADIQTQGAARRTRPSGAPVVGTAVLREKPLTGCTTITQSGRYVLRGDISAAKTCLTINADNVELQCDGHAINGGDMGIVVRSTRKFSMLNCSAAGASYGVFLQNVDGFTIKDSRIGVIQVSDSQNGKILNNELNGVNASRSRYVNTTDNQIHGGYDQGTCSFMTVSGNDITYTPNSYQNGIALFQGDNNTISDNRIDGGWKGYASDAYDNGIQVDQEDHTTISHNTIQNTYNNGMELNGPNSHLTIEENHITNVASAGFGANYGTSWDGNILRNNTVSQASSFASILFSADAGNNLTTIYFRNNIIEGNTFRPDTHAWGPSLSVNLTTRADGQPLPGTLVAENNMVQNNDFGTRTPAPRANPSSAFVDGGGNICGDPMPQGAFLTCQRSTN